MNETLDIIGVFVQPDRGAAVWLNEAGQFICRPVHEFVLDRAADAAGRGVPCLRRVSDQAWGCCDVTSAVAWGRAMRRSIRLVVMDDGQGWLVIDHLPVQAVAAFRPEHGTTTVGIQAMVEAAIAYGVVQEQLLPSLDHPALRRIWDRA